MMFCWRYQILIYGMMICLVITGCVPNTEKQITLPSTPTIGLAPANGKPQVKIEWTYRDDQRFAVELSITNYPLAHGFQTTCPLTQLEIKNSKGKNLLLYKNPEQIGLDEFYTIAQHDRWLCKKQTEHDGFVDYIFSLIHYYDGVSDLSESYVLILSVDLGEVLATNSNAVITLPSQGIFDLPLTIETGSKKLTWLGPVVLNNNGILVEINRVAVNPSFASMDACVEYQDHQFWQPIAVIIVQGREMSSTEFIPTLPRYPFTRDNILESTYRCYFFIIPIDFPTDSSLSFQIGIKQMEIVNTDPGVVSQQDCEAVKIQVEKEKPGLGIRCYEFETRGQQQHWFEILSTPPGLSTQDAYGLVESAFIKTISGPWYMDIP